MRRKQEILGVFCFLISLFPLSAQDVQFSSDQGSLQVLFEKKFPLDLLAVYAGENTPVNTENIPAMLGNFTYEKDVLCFTPTFPFQPEQKYHLFEGQKYLLSFQLPEEDLGPKTILSEIFPSADTVPANLLKIYLYFSAPMREGFAYQHIWLTNSQGDTLVRPILELVPELWDIHSQRLTLWFDPGRIKRELIPNKDMGTPLEAGETYTLHISSDWKDVSGRKLGSDLMHTFYVSTADRIKPLPKTWTLGSPKPASREPLSIDFGESMDQALGMNTITIWKEGQIIAGEIQLLAKESIWTFRPNKNWQEGTYTVYIESRLEDLAGNNLNRLFDRDMLKEKNMDEDKEMFGLTFKVNF